MAQADKGLVEARLDVADGRISDAALFFFHRQSSDKHDLRTEKGARAAVIEASGDAASWRDIDAIMELWRDPTTDRTFWELVWCNRRVKSSHRAFDAGCFKSLKKSRSPVQEGDEITVGFDGAMFHDSTGIVATHVESGYQWVSGDWECPFGREDWRVPAEDVDAAVRGLFEHYRVLRMYADPPYWQAWVSKWAGDYGEKVVLEWWTNRRKPMSYALEAYDTAIREGGISHDGNEALIRHIGNAHKRELGERDEQGKRLWLIQKERHDSPHKIDLAMAAVLSWEARNDAIAAGALSHVPWVLAPDPEEPSEAESAEENGFIPIGTVETW